MSNIRVIGRFLSANFGPGKQAPVLRQRLDLGARCPCIKGIWKQTEEGTMYKRIMVPVDMAHTDKLGKAIDTAAGLAKEFGSDLTFVGIADTAPSKVARFPSQYVEKLRAFAEQEAQRSGVGSRPIRSAITTWPST
jgi:hypothetical protein